jgi:hypothetical protein
MHTLANLSVCCQTNVMGLSNYIHSVNPVHRAKTKPAVSGTISLSACMALTHHWAAIPSRDKVNPCITPKIKLSIRVLCNVLECLVEDALIGHDENMISRGFTVLLGSELIPLLEFPQYYASLFISKSHCSHA